MSIKSYEVSIIIPAYNLSTKIQRTLKEINSTMRKENIDYEIIVVDDGSIDDTYRKVLEVANERTRILHYENNRGKGYALLYGFKFSTGNIVLFFDGDLDIHPEQIRLLLRTIRKPGIDGVITSKWHSQSKVSATFIRRVLSKAFNFLVQLLTGIRLRDTQTGAKAFKRYVLENIIRLLTIKRYAFDVELLLAMVANGYRIEEIPALYQIKLRNRFRFKEIIKMFIDLLAITYRHRVKKQYTRSILWKH